MRLLIVSHSYVLANTRGKIRELGRMADVTLLIPSKWPFGMVTASAEPEATALFDVVMSPVALAGRNIRYVYSPRTVWRSLRCARPECVLVEEESGSLALAQFSLLSRWLGFRLLFFAWENINWRPRLTRWTERLNFATADGAVVGSQEAAHVLRKKGFARPVAVVPQMGVDIQQFCPNDWPPPAPPFVICYAGRFVEEKGLRALFQAAACLTGKWELHMIGDGPLRTELQRLAERSGWASRLRWLGYVERHEMPTHLRRAHVLVLPSHSTGRWKEQFGRVLIEAMACGVPVVGSDSGAIPEVIGDAGLIFPQGDASRLGELLQSLMDNPGLRQELSAQAVQRVRDRFTDRAIAEVLYDFLIAPQGQIGA